MKTSNEIKAFLIEKLEAKDPMGLYFEFFEEIEEKQDVNHVKSVMYRWQAACREVQKERGWNGIDETFPKSIFCWNATINAIDSGHAERSYRAIKQAFGWDVKSVAEGKHCNIAQIIIDVLQRHYINKQKERLGWTGEKKEGRQ